MEIGLRGVSKSFGSVPALVDVDETLADGSLVALLGPSGCGKTTLLRVIAGLEYPDAGEIYFGGIAFTDVPLRKRNVGFVFQNYALFPHLDVATNIGFALSVRGVERARRASRVEELLALVRLEGFQRRKPHQLSGGQRQRVALARALAAEPSVLLLDEPFAALDAQVRKELRRWIRSLHDQTKLTTIIVTHDAEEAMEIADRIVLLDHGRVQQSGAPRVLYRQPANRFVMEFFGPVNELHSDEGPRFVRPHEFRIAAHPFAGALPARVERIQSLGPIVRAECRFDDGQAVTAELPDERAEELALTAGALVYLLPFDVRPTASVPTWEKLRDSNVA